MAAYKRVKPEGGMANASQRQKIPPVVGEITAPCKQDDKMIAWQRGRETPQRCTNLCSHVGMWHTTKKIPNFTVTSTVHPTTYFPNFTCAFYKWEHWIRFVLMFFAELLCLLPWSVCSYWLKQVLVGVKVFCVISVCWHVILERSQKKQYQEPNIWRLTSFISIPRPEGVASVSRSPVYMMSSSP